ncbi:hypothetical protein FV242_21230 [Methylobacterium sp. WL64]|uniref:hypothetical protein n=1 Tax=Methylobacterium sp. WL64 TaxID=2603894 RepID=UPI0011D6188E|nr:hypothetical protein [Methylobacterium sp. WL64]TXN00698.1 hypothetical protein FV242_21230 [Methylobacterium sp. WL64]
MRRATAMRLVIALAGFASDPAAAQHRGADRPHRRGTIERLRFGVPPPPATTLRPADDGIIHWNTPNKDGNLGGPGTGGGGGGGG